MQFLALHPAAPGSARWRLEVRGKPDPNGRYWLVISTVGGTRIEIPINEPLRGDIECCSGSDADGFAVCLYIEAQLMANRAEAAEFYGLGERGSVVPMVSKGSGEHA
jgi:hypothetical protein